MEFRQMRRKNQLLSEAECIKILNSNTSGVMSVIGDDGYPYGVPLSYVYLNDKIYFHTAVTGHKIDAIKNNDKVSFCIVDQDKIVPEKFTTYFRSVVIFGRARILQNDDEIKYTLTELAKKYAPNESASSRDEEIKNHPNLFMVEIEIEHMTGKAAKELVNNPQSASE